MPDQRLPTPPQARTTPADSPRKAHHRSAAPEPALRPGRVPHLFRLTVVVDKRLRALAESYGLDLLGTASLAVTELYKSAVVGGILKPS